MRINETLAGAVCILAPEGALCGTDAQEFRDAVLAATARRRGRVVIDATAMPFVDSEGLEALLDLTEAMDLGGRTLKICHASDTVREALEIVGVAGLFELFDDVNGAVRSFL